jgi:mono/diheme cytochrome c family protein
MRFIAGVICALVMLGVASVAYVYSGWFDVAASSPHNALERWALNTTMKRSVVAGAQSVGDPPAFSDEMVRDGFEHYDEMCTVCHAGPGIDQSKISKGLNPPPPNLADAVKDWTPRQLFWIVKHGVKMTAMPSFGATHSDEEVWNIVAFIEKLPEISPHQYEQLKHQMPARSHEPMMQH